MRAALGDPREVRRGFLRYCAAGGGELLVGEPGDRSGAAAADPQARVAMVVTTAPDLLAARPSARGARPVLRAGAVRVVRLRGGVLAGIRAHHVRFLAVRDRTVVRSRGALRRWLVRAGTLPSGRP